MSVHSYSRCWLHLIWTTLNRERMLFGDKAMKVSAFLSEYAESKGIYMKINYVNPEHVHALIDLPTQYSIEEIFKLIKGASSHWINQNRLVGGKFFWGRGYGVFFGFVNPILLRLPGTLQRRRSIIGSERS